MGNRTTAGSKGPEDKNEVAEEAPVPICATPQTIYATRVGLIQLEWLPAGICVTNADTVVSCDCRGGVVSVYDRKNTSHVDILVKNRSLEVWDVAYSQAEIYVTDSSTGLVRAYSETNGLLTKTIDLGLKGQKEIAVDVSGSYLYVASRRTKVVLRVHLQNEDEAGVETFAEDLQGPWFVSATGDHVAVCCVGNNTVVVFDVKGQLICTYGKGDAGLGPDDLHTPMTVLLDPRHEQGRVYVADFNNHRVCVFAATDGRTIGHINLRKDGLGHPRGLAWDKGGNLCVACGGQDTPNTIVIYSLAIKEDHVHS